jgi:hypothetical protein
VTKFFVYRAPDNLWWISSQESGREWESFKHFQTWREAFEYAFRLAKSDRNRYRQWWPKRVAS